MFCPYLHCILELKEIYINSTDNVLAEIYQYIFCCCFFSQCHTQAFFLLLLFCSTFGLDGDSAINLYITTLLLQEDRWYEMEIEEGDAKGTLRAEESLLRKDDMLERALQIVPQLGSTKDLVFSLNSALTKVLYCILHL